MEFRSKHQETYRKIKIFKDLLRKKITEKIIAFLKKTEEGRVNKEKIYKSAYLFTNTIQKFPHFSV